MNCPDFACAVWVDTFSSSGEFQLLLPARSREPTLAMCLVCPAGVTPFPGDSLSLVISPSLIASREHAYRRGIPSVVPVLITRVWYAKGALSVPIPNSPSQSINGSSTDFS